MDHKTFIAGLARQIGMDAKDTETFAEALATVIKEKASNLEAIAIPGFGRFETIKTAEYVSSDTASGKLTLYPPEIKFMFTPGSMLKKRLSNE